MIPHPEKPIAVAARKPRASGDDPTLGHGTENIPA